MSQFFFSDWRHILVNSYLFRLPVLPSLLVLEDALLLALWRRAWYFVSFEDFFVEYWSTLGGVFMGLSHGKLVRLLNEVVDPC